MRSVALILTLLVLAGCTTPEAGPGRELSPAPPPSPPPAEVGTAALAIRPLLNATADQRVTFAIALQQELAKGNASLALVGGGARGPDVGVSPVDDVTLAFLPFDVPASASRRLILDLEVWRNGTLAHVERQVAEVEVMGAAPGFTNVSSGLIRYTGRVEATGELFATGEPALRDLPYPRTAGYVLMTSAYSVRSVPQPNVVRGLHEALIGMQAGESRTVIVPPEKAYGNGTLFEREPRDERIPREYVLKAPQEEVARETFEAHIRSLGQDPADYAVGDLFAAPQGGNAWRNRILAMDGTTVRFRLHAEIGEAYTLYPFWPNASVVTVAGSDGYVLETTPTTTPGEPLTVRSSWPAMSTLVSYDEAEIVVRHSPPPDLTYDAIDAAGVRRTVTVVDVTDDLIVTSFANPSPLAGKTLVYDVELLSFTIA